MYAVSRDEEFSNIEIANKILKILDQPKDLITFVKDRPGHDRRYSVNSSKLRKLGWKPKYTIDEQLEKTIAWYNENNQWLKDILKRSGKLNKHIKL